MRSTAQQMPTLNHSYQSVFQNLPRELVQPVADLLQVQVARLPLQKIKIPLHRHKKTPPLPACPKKIPPALAHFAEMEMARKTAEFQVKVLMPLALRGMDQSRLVARQSASMQQHPIEQLPKPPREITALPKMTPPVLAPLFKIQIAPQKFSQHYNQPRQHRHHSNRSPRPIAFHFQMFPTRKKKPATPPQSLLKQPRNPSTRHFLAIGVKLTPHSMNQILRPADLINPFSPFVPRNDQCRSIEVGERRRNLSLRRSCEPPLI